MKDGGAATEFRPVAAEMAAVRAILEVERVSVALAPEDGAVELAARAGAVVAAVP